MTHQNKKVKRIYLQIILFSGLLFFIGCNTGEREVYILPKNYIGVVYVLFNQKLGEKPKYEAGKRVYEIPSSGILKTQFSFNDGWHGMPEYYYADGNNKKMIIYQLDTRGLRQNKLQVCCTQNFKTGNETKGSVQYERFFIGTKQQIDSVFEIEQRRDIFSKSFSVGPN